MTIREYKTEDLEKLVNLAEKHDLFLPPNGMVNVAENNNGDIAGMMLIRMVPTIEPFICTNPMIAKKLFDFTFNQAKEHLVDMNILRCYAKIKHVELYKKLGFYEVFNNHIIMEKGL